MVKGCLEWNNLDKAKPYLHECMQIDQKDAWSCVMLGNSYARNENNPDVAAFCNEKCL